VTDTSWATQLLGADTLSASRAVLNSNFNAARRHTITSIDSGDSPYTATSTDFVSADATSGAVAVTLGDGTELVGDSWFVSKADSSTNAVTISPDSGTIDGESSLTLTNQYDAVRVLKIGSTNWTVIEDSRRKSGFLDYNDTTGSFAITANTWTDVPNDGLGTFTNTGYPASGVTDMLDEATGYLDFTELELGDQVLVRSDFTVTPHTNNCLLEVRYELGTGGGLYQLSVHTDRLDAGSGIGYHKVIPFPIYMGDANTRDNPGKLQFRLSTTGTFVNAGFYINIQRR
jgi:hypothetical protein